MSILDHIAAASREARPHIVLAEGTDSRVIDAGLRAAEDGLARITLVGPGNEIRARIGTATEVEVADPETDARTSGYASVFYELRKHKGASEEAALNVARSNLGFAALMVRQGDADGTLAGAVATTADVVRSALQIIGIGPGVDVVSSC